MKSQEFYLSLLEKVMLDASHHIGGKVLSRDLEEIRSRVGHEGISFLTKTMPAFAKHILRSIEDGHLTPMPGFSTRNKKSLIPAFLQGWTRRLFSDSGEHLSDFDVDSFQELYQICMLFYKLELPYPKRLEASVVTQFVKNEHEIRSPFSGASFVEPLLDGARSLLRNVLAGFAYKNIKPRHGPGAVATGQRGNEKYRWDSKFQRLHVMYPYYEYFSPSLSRISFEDSWYHRLTERINPTAKVVLVPKDSRGPRLISMEPLEIQWIQQGLMTKLVRRIEEHPLTKGFVNFEDQSINGQIALKSSLTKEYATIDLKDASDRVSLDLFREIFPREAHDHFESCRSVATILPDGAMQSLHKFAPMGSALCFPVLALTVWALAKTTVNGLLPGAAVYVYGDDLIVPSETYAAVVERLESVNLKVNSGKCYVNSHFRESCGTDAYMGQVVTPIRYRQPFIIDRPCRLLPALYCHLIDLSDAFFNKGYWETTKFLRKTLRSVWGTIPMTNSRSAPGYFTPDHLSVPVLNTGMRERFNQAYQRTEYLCRYVKTKEVASEASPRACMIKGLTGLYSHSAEQHKVTVPKSSVLKWKWFPL